MAKLELPIYDISINPNDENTGVFKISLVDSPAVQVEWLKFSEEQEVKPLIYANEEKRILYGVLLRPNQLVFRNFNGEKCYWRFSEETVELIRDKFHKLGMEHNFNLQHKYDVDGLYLVEDYLIDYDRNIAPKEFSTMENKTWIGGVKVDNLELWNAVKDDESFFNGFSVEGGVIPQLTDEIATFEYKSDKKIDEKVTLNYQKLNEIINNLPDNLSNVQLFNEIINAI